MTDSAEVKKKKPRIWLIVLAVLLGIPAIAGIIGSEMKIESGNAGKSAEDVCADAVDQKIAGKAFRVVPSGLTEIDGKQAFGWMIDMQGRRYSLTCWMEKTSDGWQVKSVTGSRL